MSIESNNFKKNVSKIYYINLYSRPDRNNETIKELEKHNLLDISKRISAYAGSVRKNFKHGSKHWLKTQDAITRSHIKAIKKAQKLNLEKVLILEDDIVFLTIDEKDPFYFINKAVSDVEKIPDWDILYLGGTLHQNSISLESEFLMKVDSILGIQAYILHNRAYNKFLKLYQYGVPPDVIALGLPNKYSVYPGPAGQRMGSLDNNGKNSPNVDPYELYVNSYLSVGLSKCF